MSHGVIAKEGSLIDASFVDVPRQRNSREENACIKKGEIPASFEKEDKNGRKSKLAQKDTYARWMTKSGERHFGYKNHINADPNTKLIARYSVSSASPHDSTEIENIVDKTDSAYRSTKIEAFLEDIKYESFVHKKGYRNNPLTEEQKQSNKTKSKIRARVEHVFGFMTNSMNNALYMRSIGLKRIKSSIDFLNLTYNLLRYEQLVRLKKLSIM